ncbi:adenylate/guanylate cyclase domain-containing protein [bacterium]|nr:adenylate/guanylate cyclase domain-containing protein [bacterium]
MKLGVAEQNLVGRTVSDGLRIGWEPALSREHVRVEIVDQSPRVTRLPRASNPVFFRGEPRDEFDLLPGDSFVIGATQFRLVKHAEADSSQPNRVIEEVRFESSQLRNIRFSDADKRIEVLTHLPGVIQLTRTDDEFFQTVVDLLLAGIPSAEAVAVVEPGSESAVVRHWQRRNETRGEVRPSTRLVRDAVATSRRSVLHVWESERAGLDQYTVTAGFNWAFCTPVSVPGEPPRGLYVAGEHEVPVGSATTTGRGAALQADVRFTELVAEIVSSLRRLSSLERQQAGLRQFFAPPILAALGEDLDTALLEPRECEVAVLFCDLRGFSQRAESQEDNLPGLLNRVSQALGVMTEQILRFGGVTGDFQGDAALGFWGWPFASETASLDACRAALGIRSAFEAEASVEGSPLAGFEMGIGIAFGRAVAGKIGTAEQVKVTVFGPVVNLASRLESMTTQLRVPILVDEPTAELVRAKLPRTEGRVRKLARVLPVGMERPVTVSELLPSAADFPLLTDGQIARYEEGVENFIAGNWDVAWQCLHEMPAGDRAQDFLAMPIVQSSRRAPADWDGVIRLARK